MPLKPRGSSAQPGWTHSDQIPRAPHDDLRAEEIDSFLTFLFADIARRPAKLTMRETVGVARYLEGLASVGARSSDKKTRQPRVQTGLEVAAIEEREARNAVLQMSMHIWGLLRQYGQFKPVTKSVATRFIKRHAHTYFANSPVEEVLAFLENFSVPSTAV